MKLRRQHGRVKNKDPICWGIPKVSMSANQTVYAEEVTADPRPTNHLILMRKKLSHVIRIDEVKMQRKLLHKPIQRGQGQRGAAPVPGMNMANNITRLQHGIKNSVPQNSHVGKHHKSSARQIQE